MDKQRIVHEFDSKANEYEQNRLASWYIAQSERLLRHIDGSAQGDVLDIGCGTGWMLRSLAAAQPGRRYVGIDLSPKMTAKARSSVPAGVDNVEFIEADWETMDSERLSSYRIATIICTSAFHYFAEPGKALRTMRETLVDNGSLYLVERDKGTSAMTVLWDFLHRHYIKDHVCFYSRPELEIMLGQAGFSNIEVLDTIKRYFWQGKLQTNIVFLRGRKAPS
jgi:ubiquinone/menaquinone biosynthesis C-methylase UbiE